MATFKKKFFFGFFIFTITAVLMLDLGNDALQSLQSFEFEGTGIISDKWYFSKMDFDREMWRDSSNEHHFDRTWHNIIRVMSRFDFLEFNLFTYCFPYFWDDLCKQFYAATKKCIRKIELNFWNIDTAIKFGPSATFSTTEAAFNLESKNFFLDRKSVV